MGPIFYFPYLLMFKKSSIFALAFEKEPLKISKIKSKSGRANRDKK